MARKWGIIREFIAVLLTIASIIAAPLMVLLIPVYLLRVVVCGLAKLFRPDLGKMLSPRGNLFAVEFNEMFTKRTRCALYVTHIIESDIEVAQFQKYFDENVIQRRSPESGDFHSPELQQTITSWLGYLFWQWDEDFKIENHVKAYTGPGPTDLMSDYDIPDIMKELARRPFPPGRSPWEMWILNNARLRRDPEQKSKTIYIFRVHHSLADGFAILRLLVEDIAKTPMTTPAVIQEKPRSLLAQAVKYIEILVKAPYQLISLSIHSWDFNEWHKPERALTGTLNMAISEPISVDYIKAIKSKYETSFHAVIQAAYAGAIRKHMIEQRMKVPATLHCMVPLPVSGHPTKLRNHMTAVLSPLPVGLEEARDRLQASEMSLRSLRNSTVPAATFCMLPLVGALPAWVVKLLATNLIATCILSIFPAPPETVYCMGHKVEDIMFGGGLLVGNVGLGFSSLSYDGLIRFGVGIDEGVYTSPEHAKSLVKRVLEELQIFQAEDAV